MTPEFVASVQRALQARDLYYGPINGVMDTDTKRAVQIYQFDQGLDTDILSVSAARSLGLWALERPGPAPTSDTQAEDKTNDPSAQPQL